MDLQHHEVVLARDQTNPVELWVVPNEVVALVVSLLIDQLDVFWSTPIVWLCSYATTRSAPEPSPVFMARVFTVLSIPTRQRGSSESHPLCIAFNIVSLGSVDDFRWLGFSVVVADLHQANSVVRSWIETQLRLLRLRCSGIGNRFTGLLDAIRCSTATHCSALKACQSFQMEISSSDGTSSITSPRSSNRTVSSRFHSGGAFFRFFLDTLLLFPSLDAFLHLVFPLGLIAFSRRLQRT